MQNYEIIRVKYMKKSLGFGGRELLDLTSEAQSMKEKIENRALSKLKAFAILR